MNVLPISQQNSLQKNNSPQFKGAVDTTLRFLATNQAVGANLVDFSFMVTPRTLNDGIKRGPAAGMETGRREIMGTFNDSCVGLFAAAAGATIAGGLSKKYQTKVNRMFTAPDTLHILAENKSKQFKNNTSQVEYLKTTLRNVKGYNPASVKADNEGFVKLSEKTINTIADYYNELLDKKIDFFKWIKNKTDKSRSVLMNEIIADTGAESKYILQSTDGKIKSETTLKSLMNDIFIVSDSFNGEAVKNAFKEQAAANKTIKENAFIKGLDKFMRTRTGMGFTIAALIGLSVQPINMYLTKLKTGTDGFVGVEGRSKDKSVGFAGLKGLSTLAFSSMVLATLNMKPWQFTPRRFMDKMSFTGKMPTINQLKGIYGLTIVSRILSSRDKDELREVLTKDTLGFLSWLVLGDIVNRMAAAGSDKSVMNYKKGTENSNYFKKMFYSSLKTRDEVLVKALADQNVKLTKEVDGKILNKTFKELMKDLNGIKDEAVKKATKKRLRVLNGAQVAGYLFSGLVLGLGIPNLNIYITNKLDKKRKAELAAQAEQNVQK